MNTVSRPLILLSNDDGVSAQGILTLFEALQTVADVIVVAPEQEHSGRSHSITLRHPLRLRQIADRIFATDGTPVDCVYVALHREGILPRRPDVVVSGINHGANLGTDVFYSGTVAAAREGALRGIPGIAISSLNLAYLKQASNLATSLITHALRITQPNGHAPLLNVNFPATQPKGMRLTRLGKRVYDDEVTMRRDPRGTEYYWVGGPGARHKSDEDTDTAAVDAGYASITPLSLESTQPNHFDFARMVLDGYPKD